MKKLKKKSLIEQLKVYLDQIDECHKKIRLEINKLPKKLLQ